MNVYLKMPVLDWLQPEKGCKMTLQDLKDFVASKQIQISKENREALDSLITEWEEEMQNNLKRDEPNKSPYSDDEGVTLFNHLGSEYFISWTQVSTPTECLLFVHHLTEKIWITRENIKFLIDCVCQKNKWGYYAESNAHPQR